MLKGKMLFLETIHDVTTEFELPNSILDLDSKRKSCNKTLNLNYDDCIRNVSLMKLEILFLNGGSSVYSHESTFWDKDFS